MMAERARSNGWLAGVRVGVFVVFCAVMLVAYLVRRWFARGRDARWRVAVRWIRAWCRGACWILGLRWRLEGELPRGACLLVPNHLGYVDFLVLGAVFPCFILSRADLLGWPGVGLLVAASENPTVSRGRGRDVRETAVQMRERLEAGHAILAFLEGTSSAGDRVLPFMPSFLQPVIDAGAPVVPVGIGWSAHDPRVDVGEDIAFWKDHEFGPHTWRLFGLRGLEAQVRIGQPIASSGRPRRELAEETRQAVCELAGLPPGERADL